MIQKIFSTAAIVISMAISCPAAEPTDTLMRREADAFLAATPSSVQVKQRDAVRRAAWGDTLPLLEIRKSRRPEITLSTNVDTLHIAGGHILFRPKSFQSGKLPLLVYLHGGGWTFGSPASASRFCNALAASGEVMVLDLDYPLSPEHSEYVQSQWLKELTSTLSADAAKWGANPGRIFIGGDSAGGYMAMLTALLAPRKFAGVIPVYPVIRHYPDEDASSRYAIGYANNGDLMEAFYQAWQCHNPADADVPRLLTAEDGQLRQMPAVLMIAAERDVLCQQGKEFAERLSGLGVNVMRKEYPGAVHLFITVPGQPAAFGKAVEDVLRFVRENQ